MGLISENTCWLFMLPSTTSVEQRHVYDIAFGIHVLLQRDVSIENIVLLIDGCTPSLLTSTFSALSVPVPNKVYSTGHYFQLLKENIYNNIVIFITGHGSINGIDSVIPIKPYDFYNALKTSPNLNKAVIYFGQCEDGIYNYVSLKTDKENFNGSKIVAIGASGLHNSLSSSSIIEGGMWSANVFLARLFSWI